MSSNHPLRTIRLILALGGALAVAGCLEAEPEPFTPPVRPTQGFPNIGYATWTDDEPQYRFYPGDQVELRVPSAPELNKTLTVQPDGRISPPLVGQIMVADRTTGQVQYDLTRAYSAQLVHPEVEVTLTAATPLKVFVGGEVQKPGVYDMPGPIDALQAIIEAGGFTNGAKRTQVVIVRRSTGGGAMMRTLDLRRGITDPGGADVAPLRRFDVIYVPRSSVAEVGIAMGQIRDALPFQFNYVLNPAN